MTTPDADRYRADGLTRARRDILAAVLIVVGLVGFDVLAWMVTWRAGLAVICLYVAGAGVVVGLDREGDTT